MGCEDPSPGVVDPDAVAFGVAAFVIGAERVEVGAEPVLAALENLDVACLVLVVDDVAFRGDGVTHAGVFQLQQIGDGGPVVRVEALNRARISSTWW